MNCMIIDDDEMSRRTLDQLVSQTDDLELSDTCNNAIEAMSILHSKKVDLLLLDIEMPGISGPQLLKSIKKPPMVIIVTANKEHALQAFELNVIDFLIKPVTRERFLKSIDKAREYWNQHKNGLEFSRDYLYIYENGKRIPVPLNNILFIESKVGAINIVTEDKEYHVPVNFNSLEDKLDTGKFVKIHRSFIINQNHLSSVHDSKVIIHGHILPLGTDYKANIHMRSNLSK
jgi:two-component system LytT family response regulator